VLKIADMTCILVTGGTGFLGSHLVDRLVALGTNVRILARPTSSLENIREHIHKADIEIIRGDLLHPDSLQRACDGVDAVFHTAAAVDFSLPEKTFQEVNIHALREFVNLACDAGIARFVHVSSVGFYRWSSQYIDERVEQHPTNAYEATKLEGERIVLQAHRARGLSATVIQPSFIYGPRARIGVLELIWWVKKGWLPHIDGGIHRLNMVYVSDVVDAMILAAEKEEAVGEHFVIGRHISPTYREIMDVVAESLNVSPPRWSVPYWLAKPVAVFLQSVGDLLGMKPYRFADYLDYTIRDGVLDISKASRVLGFQPKVALKEGMAKTVAWFQEHRGPIRNRESLTLAKGFMH